VADPGVPEPAACDTSSGTYGTNDLAFDADLRMRDPAWGLRQLHDVVECAARHGLGLDQVVAMPANNLSVVFRRDRA